MMKIPVTKIPVRPSSTDILCGRGRSFANHPGNLKFNQIIQANLKKYKDAPKRIDRSILLGSLVDHILDQGIRFLKKDKATKNWFELPVKQCHEKVGHALRDLIRKLQDSNNYECQSSAAIAFQKVGQDVPVLHKRNMNLFVINQISKQFLMSEDLPNKTIEASGPTALLRLLQTLENDDSLLQDDCNPCEIDDSLIDGNLVFHSDGTFHSFSNRPDLTEEASFRNFHF